MDRQQAIFCISKLCEGGLLDFALNEITKDLALEIVETVPNEMSKREDLYQLTKAIKRLNEKLQEYANLTMTSGE